MQQYKELISDNIEQNHSRITSFGRDIFEHAELGFNEYRTQQQVKNIFEELGLEIEYPLAVTGIKGILRGKHKGPTLAILGEMDALICADHPSADEVTHAAHICGHNAQLAAMVSAAYGLVHSQIRDNLYGDIVFMATPAEEYVQLEKRLEMKREGKIEFLAGKPELIRTGAFDRIDLALITHVGANIPEKRFGVGGTANGFLAKTARFIGRPAHAGGAPDQGRNALQAANIALNAINGWRETFRDEARIRVHPIITKGGDLVNTVPADVRLETYIRAKNLADILETNQKVNRALKAGALAMGCKVIIDDLPGFLPQLSSDQLVEVIEKNANQLLGREKVVSNGHFDGSADMGDLTQLIPGTIIEVGGIEGAPHTPGFKIVDEEMAYLTSGKLLAYTAVDLLLGSKQKAEEIIQSYQPSLSKEEYIKQIQAFFKTESYDYSV